jgi:hypothetical protein
MNVKTFWIGWRRDISRFVGLCLAALVLGLGVNHVVASARERINRVLPNGLAGLPRDVEGLANALDGDLLTGTRTTGSTWTYRVPLAAGSSLWIRDVNGSVTVEPGHGDSLAVSAVKTFRHSDPATVRLAAVPGADGVAICALWDAAGHCGPGDEYREHYAPQSDVAVQFTVRVPRGVRIDATTVNGAVRIVGASAATSARTVSGDVSVETSRGPVKALVVNGGIHATLSGVADSGAVKLITVNGGVTLELPARADATISANTMNGAIESDFPLDVNDKFVGHHASGAIGRGGRRIELSAVNGSVRLKKAAPPSPH